MDPFPDILGIWIFFHHMNANIKYFRIKISVVFCFEFEERYGVADYDIIRKHVRFTLRVTVATTKVPKI